MRLLRVLKFTAAMKGSPAQRVIMAVVLWNSSDEIVAAASR